MNEIPEGSTELVVVHVGLGLALAPAPRHLVGVSEFELAVGALPRDARRVGRVGKQLQQELPQLDLTRSRTRQSTARSPEHLIWICNASIFIHLSH